MTIHQLRVIRRTTLCCMRFVCVFLITWYPSLRASVRLSINFHIFTFFFKIQPNLAQNFRYQGEISETWTTQKNLDGQPLAHFQCLNFAQSTLRNREFNFVRMKGCAFFQRWDNSKTANIQWPNLKIFFSRTTLPNLIKLGTKFSFSL